MADHIVSVGSPGEVGAQSKDRTQHLKSRLRSAARARDLTFRSDLPESGPHTCESPPSGVEQCFKATRTKRSHCVAIQREN